VRHRDRRKRRVNAPELTGRTLPALYGRQVTDLIVLSCAATVFTTTSFVRNYPSVNISVAGGMHNGLTYRLDGSSHHEP
jgi:hypothetical protein